MGGGRRRSGCLWADQDEKIIGHMRKDFWSENESKISQIKSKEAEISCIGSLKLG